MGNQSRVIYPTKTSGNLEIIKYINCSNVEVRFVDTGFVTTARIDSIKRGNVKDRLRPSVCGVGFIGVGDNKVSENGKITKVYQTWQGMLQRCYSEALQKIKPWYVGCTVHPDWHNFQVFAKWYDKNYPTDGNKYDLDKDILVEGNRVYGPETCMFVSHEKNMVKARAKSFMFLNPKGEEIEIYNLRQFCRDNDLNHRVMSAVNSGKANQHKGWTVKA